MTDRVNYLTVVVSGYLREDDVFQLITAISQFKDVLTVGLNVADPAAFAAEQRAKREITDKVWEALK